MGSSFLEYQQAQAEAKHYALTKRKIQRHTFRYVVSTAFSLVITFLIAPKLVLPSLLLSVAVYGLARFGLAAYTKAKHWWLDRKSEQALTHEADKEEPLLSHTSRAQLREKANGPLTEALASKHYKIAHYEDKATFQEKEPLTYTDRKHQRALFQYRMLEHAKTAALNGDENFIDNIAMDRANRREKKIEILEKIKTYLDEGTLSLVLKHVDRTADCECVLTGTSANMLVTDIQRWNSADPMNVFVPVPTDLTPLEVRNFVKQSILPLILDMDMVVKKVANPTVGAPLGRHGKHLLAVKAYSISPDYISKRIKTLKDSRAAWEPNCPSLAV